jgi:hypothetical protein
MPVVYGSPDLLPTLSVVYACRCGLRVTETGMHAGDPPPKWVWVGEDDCICEQCAARARQAAEKSARTTAR